MALAVVGLAAPASAAAATFTVNTVDDLNDASCDVIHCSLREAINAANSTSGTDTIAFNILGPGPHSIKPLSELPPVSDPATIDGSTEPDYAGTPIVELDGTLAGSTASGLTLTGGNSTVRGLLINRFSGGAGILVGTGPPGSGSGTGSADNIIAGNFVGTDVTGTVALGNFYGVSMVGPGADRNTIGGANEADRNLISGNRHTGVVVEGGVALPGGNVVIGNYIGTDLSGNSRVPNGHAGVILQNAIDNVVGGAALSRRNVISGNAFYGVRITNQQSTGNRVQGNYIGVGADGTTPLGGANSGVNLLNAQNNLIGGPPGTGNVIAHHGREGVLVERLGTSNGILANSIFGNGGLGIDLQAITTTGIFGDGVTLNDGPGDADSGGNELQNFPVLTSAASDGNTEVQGTLTSKPNTTYRLEFFANGECDPSGHGEGEIFLGAEEVTTDASGNAAFSVSVSSSDPGQFISATATDPDNNTSEFSNCQQVTQAQSECSDGIDNDGDGRIDHPGDRQCESPDDPSERPQCSDGIDNDADGAVDYPDDTGCRRADDNSEAPNVQCSDGVDNDGDGAADHPDDPGCTSPRDNRESPNPQCSDGIDNDGDGAADHPDDPGCTSPRDNRESPNPQCSDGIDNDGDGRADHPGDPGCRSPRDNTEDSDSPAI